MARVKCVYCDETFDKDKVAYVSPKNRRYGHAQCYLRKRAEDPKLPELEIVDPADIVSCNVCKQKFNKKTEPFKLINSKYYHAKCAELEAKREKTDAEKLDAYIMELFKVDYVSPRIKKQINEYISKYNYTYTGILKALIYFYQVKKNSIEKSQNGIGIVPYIYNDAYNYYYSLWLAEERNKDIKKIDITIKEIHIPVPQRKVKKRKLFEFLDEEEDME